MNAITAVSSLLSLTAGAIEFMIQAEKISKVLAKAHAEKREITNLEWTALDNDLKASQSRLNEAIKGLGHVA